VWTRSEQGKLCEWVFSTAGDDPDKMIVARIAIIDGHAVAVSPFTIENGKPLEVPGSEIIECRGYEAMLDAESEEAPLQRLPMYKYTGKCKVCDEQAAEAAHLLRSGEAEDGPGGENLLQPAQSNSGDIQSDVCVRRRSTLRKRMTNLNKAVKKWLGQVERDELSQEVVITRIRESAVVQHLRNAHGRNFQVDVFVQQRLARASAQADVCPDKGERLNEVGYSRAGYNRSGSKVGYNARSNTVGYNTGGDAVGYSGSNSKVGYNTGGNKVGYSSSNRRVSVTGGTLDGASHSDTHKVGHEEARGEKRSSCVLGLHHGRVSASSGLHSACVQGLHLGSVPAPSKSSQLLRARPLVCYNPARACWCQNCPAWGQADVCLRSLRPGFTSYEALKLLCACSSNRRVSVTGGTLNGACNTGGDAVGYNYGDSKVGYSTSGNEVGYNSGGDTAGYNRSGSKAVANSDSPGLLFPLDVPGTPGLCQAAGTSWRMFICGPRIMRPYWAIFRQNLVSRVLFQSQDLQRMPSLFSRDGARPLSCYNPARACWCQNCPAWGQADVCLRSLRPGITPYEALKLLCAWLGRRMPVLQITDNNSCVMFCQIENKRQ